MTIVDDLFVVTCVQIFLLGKVIPCLFKKAEKIAVQSFR